MSFARLPRAVAAGVAALACLVALAACGSSKPKNASGHRNVFIAFSRCMRAHGVTNFPDPSGGGAIRINVNGSGINPRSPAFEAAQKACFKLLPGGGPLNHKPSAEQIRQTTATAQCMREHGVSGFPDPIVSNQPPTDLNPANYSLVSDQGGIIIAIPKSIDPGSPGFQAAAKACGFNR